MATPEEKSDLVEGELFKEVEPSGFASFVGNDKVGLANFLVPAETGAISVVNDFPWTLTPKSGRSETPHVRLTEYRLLQSALWNSARYYATGIIQQVLGSQNPFLSRMQGYAGLFDYENPTKFEYTFPYFSDTANEVQSSWSSLDILEKIKGIVGGGGAIDKGIDVLMLGYEANYPRVGIMDRPKLWQESTPRSINIKFPLYNTVDVKDIPRNWELCYLLLYQNMFNKRDFITAIPPVFYTAYIPGQFFSIAMYVSDLKIYNRGNIRMYQIGDKWRNIPDVYEIDMTLTDMIMPSQNMLAQVLRETPVSVQQFDPSALSEEQIKQLEDSDNLAANAVGFTLRKAKETINLLPRSIPD
jgi:hypothetical protein